MYRKDDPCDLHLSAFSLDPLEHPHQLCEKKTCPHSKCRCAEQK